MFQNYFTHFLITIYSRVSYYQFVSFWFLWFLSSNSSSLLPTQECWRFHDKEGWGLSYPKTKQEYVDLVSRGKWGLLSPYREKGLVRREGVRVRVRRYLMSRVFWKILIFYSFLSDFRWYFHTREHTPIHTYNQKIKSIFLSPPKNHSHISISSWKNPWGIFILKCFWQINLTYFHVNMVIRKNFGELSTSNN